VRVAVVSEGVEKALGWGRLHPVGRARLLEDRWLRAREMRAIRIKRSYIENSRKKEEGKGGLRSLEGSRKTGA